MVYFIWKVSDPMGRVHYWLIGDSLGTLAFYDAEKTAYQSGKEGRTYFRKFFGINLSWTELENLWMGILPPAWRAQLTGDWTSKEGSFEGKIRNDKELINFQVSEKNGELQQVLWRTENKLIEILFTDFDACCSREGVQTQLGHSVSIKLPSRSDKIELEWEELNLLVEEPNPLGFSRKISARIKRVDLEE
ncbi:MAG: DUF4292 domain-containing protein [Proteobacteria bacterium]|nr:DUF4292 domain-containing protein [Pseudomonadota bacterium]